MGTQQGTPISARLKHVYGTHEVASSGSYGSPISGLCAGAAAAAWANAGERQSSSPWSRVDGTHVPATERTGCTQNKPHSPVYLSPRHSPTSSMSWAPNNNSHNVLATSSSSRPELWHGQHTSQYQDSGLRHTQHTLDAADSTPPRDQRLGSAHWVVQPNVSHQQEQAYSLTLPQQCQPPASGQRLHASQSQLEPQQHGLDVPGPAALQLAQQGPSAAPLDVLLAPLLPSADEGKVMERLSQLRQALEEQHRLAAGWEHQAVKLQQALTEGQHENLTMRGQLIALQQNISLLGGNLQGRLSIVQGSVLTQLQAQVAEKDSVIAAGQQKLAAFQLDLEKLNCALAAKLVAEQTERERLSAEAAQARLLCQARSRQLTELQEEVLLLKQDASKQQETASVGAELQQQQLEHLHQKVQELEQELVAARQAAADAQQQVSAAEGGRLGLRQQVEELQSALAEKQLQIDWLESKVADLESSDLNSQLKRHTAEVTRLKAAAAAERQALEQQLAQMRDAYADLQQQSEQQQQQLQEQEQGQLALQQQLDEQQEAAEQQICELQQQLQAAETQLQQLSADVEAVRSNASNSWQNPQQQQKAQSAAAMASDSDDEAAAAVNRSFADHVKASVAAVDSQNRPGTPAAAAVEHALRAQLGIVNAEVARLRHELDVAKAAQSEERQLTGAEIMRLQQELSEAAASASSTAGAADAAASGEPEVTSQPALADVTADNSSGNSWHSVHDNPAYEQQQILLESGSKQQKHSAVQELPAVVSQYEARLQDQAETIGSLQQQLKQQQQLLATLRKPERRVYDSAASRSSWHDILTTDEDSRLHAATAAARHLMTPIADAGVQTDGCSPTESAGSTAAVAAADDGGGDITSPRHTVEQRQQQQQQDDGVWCEGAAGSALLSAARQEIQRLQELNQQLLQTHAEEMKNSVSFEAARRALSEAKAHAKSKAAAVLQASNKTWQDKLNVLKQEKQQLLLHVQDLQQQIDYLQQQAGNADRAQAAVADLQQQLNSAHAEVQQSQRQMSDLMDSHAQELEQLRMELEAETAAAILDAGAAVARTSLQRQQQMKDAGVQVSMQVTPLLLEASVQTEEPLQQQPQVVVVQQVMQQHDLLVDDLLSQQQCSGLAQSTEPPGMSEMPEPQQQQQAATAVAERPETPQAAPGTPAAAAANAVGGSSDAAARNTLAAVAPATTSAAAAGSAAAVPPAAAGPAAIIHAPPVLQHWHTADAADDDMCRMSSASDTPASHSSRLNNTRMHNSSMVPAAAPAAAAADGSGSSEYGDCSSSSACCLGDEGSKCGGVARPSSAGTMHLPELQNSTSPVAAARSASGLAQVQQKDDSSLLDQPLLPQQQQQQEEEAAAARLSSWHAELLQQQAQLDKLRMRLSQHQQHKQQPLLGRQQQLLGSSGGSSSLLGHHRFAANNNSRGPESQMTAAATAAGSSVKGSMGHIPQLRADSPVLEPVAGGNSPMTWTQRRQQRQQQQRDVAYTPAAGQWAANTQGLNSHKATAAASSSSSSGGGYPSATTTATLAAAGGGRLVTGIGQGHQHRQYNAPDMRYNSTDTWQTADGGPAGASAVDTYDVTKTFTNSLYQDQCSRPAAAAPAGSSSFLNLGVGRSAAACCSATNPLDAMGSLTVTSESTLRDHVTSTTTANTPAQHGKVTSSLGIDGVTNLPCQISSPAGAVAPLGGLDKMHDDVMGALSLSRYHRERSKQQEARAKQHALNAQDALDRAAAVRSSRLSGTTAAAASSSDGAAVNLGGRFGQA